MDGCIAGGICRNGAFINPFLENVVKADITSCLNKESLLKFREYNTP